MRDSTSKPNCVILTAYDNSPSAPKKFYHYLIKKMGGGYFYGDGPTVSERFDSLNDLVAALMNPTERLTLATPLTCWPTTKVLTKMQLPPPETEKTGRCGSVGGKDADAVPPTIDAAGEAGGVGSGGHGASGELDWETCDWFFGTMKRLAAEKLVKSDAEDGCFLVRRSEMEQNILVVTVLQNPGVVGYATVADSLLSTDESAATTPQPESPATTMTSTPGVRRRRLTAGSQRRGIVRHYRIQETEDDRFFLTDREKAFVTVAELIDYHTLFSAGLVTRLTHIPRRKVVHGGSSSSGGGSGGNDEVGRTNDENQRDHDLEGVCCCCH